jgi:ATP-binding cassette subfamily C protein LapB
MGLERYDEEALAQAVTISGLGQIIAQHPEGLNMEVGPRGERLSGGERQTVALARALAVYPQVLVLDEPTSSMDNTAEAKFMKDLAPFVKDKTLIVSTHRAQLLQLVDRVIWLEQGRIILDGKKEDVMARLQGQSA